MLYHPRVWYHSESATMLLMCIEALGLSWNLFSDHEFWYLLYVVRLVVVDKRHFMSSCAVMTWKLSFLMKDIQPENLNTSTKSNKMLVWGFLDMLSLNFPQFWTLCIHSGNCYHLMFKHMTVVIGFLIYMPGFWSKQFQD